MVKTLQAGSKLPVGIPTMVVVPPQFSPPPPKSSRPKRKRRKKGQKRSERFFHPKVKSGWKKSMPKTQRRKLVLKAHKGDYLAAARSKQTLANVTKDKGTKEAAGEDAKYFLQEYHRREK